MVRLHAQIMTSVRLEMLKDMTMATRYLKQGSLKEELFFPGEEISDCRASRGSIIPY
jgi:hypothetical protein